VNLDAQILRSMRGELVKIGFRFPPDVRLAKAVAELGLPEGPVSAPVKRVASTGTKGSVAQALKTLGQKVRVKDPKTLAALGVGGAVLGGAALHKHRKKQPVQAETHDPYQEQYYTDYSPAALPAVG
jgi:hypothetical protein